MVGWIGRLEGGGSERGGAEMEDEVTTHSQLTACMCYSIGSNGEREHSLILGCCTNPAPKIKKVLKFKSHIGISALHTSTNRGNCVSS